jgi:hypothetical protein
VISQRRSAGKCALIRITVILVAADALAGCGHDVYQRTGTTQAQYIQDEESCWAYAENQPPAALGGNQAYSLNVEKQRQDIRACMVARGYLLEPKWPFGPYGVSPLAGPNPAATPLNTRR